MLVTMQATAKETAAVFIARQINNGDYIALGANLPVPAGGVILAQMTHAPDAKISVLSYFVNLADVESFPDLGQIANPSVARLAEGIMSIEQLVYGIRRMDLCFAGSIQIDRFGNTNLVGIGDDFNNLKFRGPGSVGTSTVMANCRKFFIYSNNHSPRTLVSSCDFITAYGWGSGGADSRTKLGLPGEGPKYVITPKAIMDFDEDSKHMRLKHLLPGTTLADVIQSTGFELIVPEQLEECEPPSVNELEILRLRVDLKGYLRKN